MGVNILLSKKDMDIAVQMANGIPLSKIAKEYGCSIQNISQLKRKKDFSAYLDKLMKEKQKETQKKLRSYGPDAVAYIYSVMNNTDESTKLRLDAAFRIIEYTVPKPKEEADVEVHEEKEDLFKKMIDKKKEAAKLVVLKNDKEIDDYVEDKISGDLSE
jgi:Fe2+ transport system protein B